MSLESELAKTFDGDVMSRYGSRIVELMLERFPRLSAPVRALDLNCGTGFATLPVIARLPPGSTVVVVGDDRFSLKQFHQKLEPGMRRWVFPRKDNIHRLPIADATMDLVWGVFPTRVPVPARSFLRHAVRVLRPGGELILCLPLHGTFLNMLEAISRVAPERTELSLPRLLAESQQLMSYDEWTKLVSAAGAENLEAKRVTFTIPAEPPLSSDRLIARHLRGLWLTEIGVRDVDALLDRAVVEPIDVVVHVGVLRARRP